MQALQTIEQILILKCESAANELLSQLFWSSFKKSFLICLKIDFGRFVFVKSLYLAENFLKNKMSTSKISWRLTTV